MQPTDCTDLHRFLRKGVAKNSRFCEDLACLVGIGSKKAGHNLKGIIEKLAGSFTVPV
jgi:hypothetical protein